tara:strand:+ start:113 stop:538 length:426 start_codon:yes stop_codon:yes gene_type:complete
MNVHMDESMFELLTQGSMEWGEKWREQLDRFECHGKHHTESPSLAWEMAYWIGGSPASMVLARSWLLEEGHDFELVWDMAQYEDGACFGYAILTNYRTASWHEHSLAVWCDEQRDAYARGALSDYQIRKIESLPGWSWEKQ